jgi:hypothetical protein
MIDFNEVARNCNSHRTKLREVFEEYLRAPTGFNKNNLEAGVNTYNKYLHDLNAKAGDELFIARQHLKDFGRDLLSLECDPKNSEEEIQMELVKLLRAVRHANNQHAQVQQLISHPPQTTPPSS